MQRGPFRDKWKKLKVGNRVAIYWRDDGVFYNATIEKQQLNTSYFHVLYEDDGASEWLDMSREPYKVLDKVKDATSLAASTPERPARRTIPSVSDATPRIDNRARSIDENQEESNPMNIPDKYLHLAPFLRRSWIGLGLGDRAGTPAYNSFVAKRDNSAQKATAMDLLADLRAIRTSAFSGISLELDDEIASNITSIDIDDAEALESNQRLMKQLRNIEDQISRDNDVVSSTKHFDQTLNAVRKEADKWSTSTVRKILRTIETQVLELNEQESRILAKCKEKGLI